MAATVTQSAGSAHEARRLLVVAASAELYGSDRTLLNALPELIEEFDVTVVFPLPGPTVARMAALGAETVVLPDYGVRRRHLRPRALPGWLFRYVTAAASIWRLHRRRRFDLVYSNTLAAGLGAMLRTVLRVPHVLHVHECPQTPPWLPRVLLGVARWSSDTVICNSAYIRDCVLRAAPGLRGRTVVILNGIDLPLRTSGRNNGSTGPLRVHCIGRLSPHKGQAVLLEAAAIARDAGSDWVLDFYGDGLPEHAPSIAALYRLVDTLGLGDIVRWHGFDDDNARIYEEADVSVVPSTVPEAFSLVCVESQSMELPVVATGPGGPSEIVIDGETGFIVPPADPKALADAIRKLEFDPALRIKMGRTGRDRMVESFSREGYAAAIRNVCRAALGQT